MRKQIIIGSNYAIISWKNNTQNSNSLHKFFSRNIITFLIRICCYKKIFYLHSLYLVKDITNECDILTYSAKMAKMQLLKMSVIQQHFPFLCHGRVSALSLAFASLSSETAAEDCLPYSQNYKPYLEIYLNCNFVRNQTLWIFSPSAVSAFSIKYAKYREQKCCEKKRKIKKCPC